MEVPHHIDTILEMIRDDFESGHAKEVKSVVRYPVMVNNEGQYYIRIDQHGHAETHITLVYRKPVTRCEGTFRPIPEATHRVDPRWKDDGQYVVERIGEGEGDE